MFQLNLDGIIPTSAFSKDMNALLLTDKVTLTGMNVASCSDTTTVDSDDPTSSDCSALQSHLIVPPKFLEKPKRRGGWPKGRKRKPEFLHLPPKAPATGYNIYLNDTRDTFKDSGLPIFEITKAIGSKWSSLSLEEKKPYLLMAEVDKHRYRNEFREYRQSGSYQLYLARKRKKKVQNNILSESDMDATDDIDEEDNEELYCRTCDQSFHNLHNKNEHLQSGSHMRAVVGDMRSELATENNSRTGAQKSTETELKSVSEVMVELISAVSKQKKDINSFNMLVEQNRAVNAALTRQLASLKERETRLRCELVMSQRIEKTLEQQKFDLWQVPSLFITTDLCSDDMEPLEYSLPE